MDRSTPGTADAQAQVLGLIAQMRAEANKPSRVVALSDQMELLVRSYLEPSLPDPVPGVRLSRMEGRIVARLQKVPGAVVSRQSLMDAMYFDRVDEPESKIIDVLICRMRKKLRGTGYEIVSDWGLGYRMRKVV